MDTRTHEILSYEEMSKRLEDKPEDAKYYQEVKIDLTNKQIKKKKLGRNDKCICGSNIKYKKCCMKKGN